MLLTSGQCLNLLGLYKLHVLTVNVQFKLYHLHSRSSAYKQTPLTSSQSKQNIQSKLDEVKCITMCMKWICTVVDQLYFADAGFVYLNQPFM